MRLVQSLFVGQSGSPFTLPCWCYQRYLQGSCSSRQAIPTLLPHFSLRWCACIVHTAIQCNIGRRKSRHAERGSGNLLNRSIRASIMPYLPVGASTDETVIDRTKSTVTEMCYSISSLLPGHNNRPPCGLTFA